jgi:hypothetical protein
MKGSGEKHSNLQGFAKFSNRVTRYKSDVDEKQVSNAAFDSTKMTVINYNIKLHVINY